MLLVSARVMGVVDDIAGHRDKVEDRPGCEDALADDLGWSGDIE